MHCGWWANELTIESWVRSKLSTIEFLPIGNYAQNNRVIEDIFTSNNIINPSFLMDETTGRFIIFSSYASDNFHRQWIASPFSHPSLPSSINISYNENNFVYYGDNLYQITSPGTSQQTGSTPPTHTTGALTIDGIEYTYIGPNNETFYYVYNSNGTLYKKIPFGYHYETGLIIDTRSVKFKQNRIVSGRFISSSEGDLFIIQDIDGNILNNPVEYAYLQSTYVADGFYSFDPPGFFGIGDSRIVIFEAGDIASRRYKRVFDLNGNEIYYGFSAYQSDGIEHIEIANGRIITYCSPGNSERIQSETITGYQQGRWEFILDGGALFYSIYITPDNKIIVGSDETHPTLTSTRGAVYVFNFDGTLQSKFFAPNFRDNKFGISGSFRNYALSKVLSGTSNRLFVGMTRSVLTDVPDKIYVYDYDGNLLDTIDSPSELDESLLTTANTSGSYQVGYGQNFYHKNNIYSIYTDNINSVLKIYKIYAENSQGLTQHPNDERIILSFDRSSVFRFGIGSDSRSGVEGKPCFSFTTSSGSVDDAATSFTGNLIDGQWRYIAVTYSRFDEFVKYYIDGELVHTSSISTTSGISGQATGEFPRYGWIGNGSEAASPGGSIGPGNMFYGDVSIIRFYDSNALTDREISLNYQAQKLRFYPIINN